jgi:glycosyltransferase involved in cell wall biosynthesis
VNEIPDSGSANGHKNKVRLLQIVESLDNRAVESWLFRVFRHSIELYPNFEWTFFCVLPRSGEFDVTARQLGAEVIHSRYEIGDKIRFLSSLREVMKKGNYDILHCHHDVMSAPYLISSTGLPFSKRIVHIHNTAVSLPTPSRLKTNLFRRPMRQICLRMADQIVGISTDALESLIGKRRREAGRHSVVHYGIDTARFHQNSSEPAEFRKGLGFDPESKVLLFVGRLVEYKNPKFVISVLEQLQHLHEQIVAVFAGRGDQENELREIVKNKSLENRVRMIGFRDDIPNLMLNSDLLLWPSAEDPKEGLGLGIVEAQAAGLPILMSRSVPDEAIVIPELVSVLPLAAGPKAWGDKVLNILRQRHLTRTQALTQVEASSFSLTRGVSSLMALYDHP